MLTKKKKMLNEAFTAYKEVIEKEPGNEIAVSRIQVLKRRIPKSG